MSDTRNSTLLIRLGFVIGGMVGVLLVWAFFLDTVEGFALRCFWSGLANGQLMNIGMFVHSTTFVKCASGFLVVGISAALGVNAALKSQSVAPGQSL